MKIYISVNCYCCEHRDQNLKIEKPSVGQSRGFMNRCSKCHTVNSYRIKIRNSKDIEVRTTFVEASEKGRGIYESRTGTKLQVKTEEVIQGS